MAEVMGCHSRHQVINRLAFFLVTLSVMLLGVSYNVSSPLGRTT